MPRVLSTPQNSMQPSAIGKCGAIFILTGTGIAHIHSPYHYKAFQMGLGMSGVKTVVHVHLQEGEEGLRWAFEKPPDIIITCARMLEEYVRRTLPERYQKHQRIVSVPNAIDIDRFSPGDKTTAKQRVGAPPSYSPRTHGGKPRASQGSRDSHPGNRRTQADRGRRSLLARRYRETRSKETIQLACRLSATS